MVVVVVMVVLLVAKSTIHDMYHKIQNDLSTQQYWIEWRIEIDIVTKNLTMHDTLRFTIQTKFQFDSWITFICEKKWFLFLSITPIITVKELFLPKA